MRLSCAARSNRLIAKRSNGNWPNGSKPHFGAWARRLAGLLGETRFGSFECLIAYAKTPQAFEPVPKLCGQQMSFKVAQIRLVRALASGEIGAIGEKIDDGERGSIPASEWDLRHLRMESCITTLYTMEFQYDSETLEFLSSIERNEYIDIAFSKKDLLARWPAIGAAQGATVVPTATPPTPLQA